MDYKDAVDHIDLFLNRIAAPLWRNPKYSLLERRTETALAVLKMNQQYGGGTAVH